MRKRPTTARSEESPIGAADCARRTGVTIKALRLYERIGLIKPARSASGWRLYGHSEIVRLNAIAALKALGLSLAQIRTVVDAAPLELPGVLRMQLEVWLSRRKQAVRAIALVEAALARIGTGQILSIDNLCELARSVETNDGAREWSREIINETLTPEEEREWLNYSARLSPAEVEEGRQLSGASQAIRAEFRGLMERGADPASPEVQRLLDHLNATLREFGAREKALRRLVWNPLIARKVQTMGSQLLTRNAAEGDPKAQRKLAGYIRAAQAASKWGQALSVIWSDAKALCASDENADSEAAQVLARRFEEVCADHGLGEPRVMACWLTEFGNTDPGSRWRPERNCANEVWQLIATALHARPSKG